jgi:purine-binding chemotaxis protein CheW
MDTDAAGPAATRGLLAFRIGDVDFGARIEDVAGLLEADRLTPLPGCRESVAGLVSFRGAIVVAVDLASFLGAPPASGSPRYALVLARGGDRLAIVIPTLPRLVPASELSSPELPETSDADASALVESTYRHDGAPIHCLHYWEVLHPAGAAVSDGRGAAA